MPQPKSTLRIELTAAQQAQIRKATGRSVNVLELRLQGGLEPTAGQDSAAPENRVPARRGGQRDEPLRGGRGTGHGAAGVGGTTSLAVDAAGNRLITGANDRVLKVYGVAAPGLIAGQRFPSP